MVNASVCGTEDRGFESHLPPQHILGCSQEVRHQTLTLACASSNLASPANEGRDEKSRLFIFIGGMNYPIQYAKEKFEVKETKKISDSIK